MIVFKNRKQLLKSPVILYFLEASLKLINLMENKGLKGEAFLKKMQCALCEAYSTALPVIQLDFEKTDKYVIAEEKFVIEERPYSILEKLGGAVCQEIGNPTNIVESPPVHVNLGFNLDRVYDDLKILVSLLSLSTSNSIAAGLSNFQLNFHQWGQHCSTAICMIHSSLFEVKDNNVRSHFTA